MSDLAQGVGRDVAGENDRWDLVIERLPQPSDDLQAVQTLWQIVVDDDEIRAYRLSRRQFQRPSSILGGRCAVTLFLEQQRQHLAHRRVVLDNQNCPSLVCALPYLALVEPGRWRHVFSERYLNGHRLSPYPDGNGHPQCVPEGRRR